MTDFIGGFCANYVFLKCQKGFKESFFVKENEEFCRIFFKILYFRNEILKIN
jgi:hypothetical protein